MVRSKRGIEAADLFRIKVVNDPNVSPDGRRVAFTVTEMDEKENAYRSAIWLLDLDGGEPRRLTSGRHRDGQPRWSPDPSQSSGQASTIAFTSDRQPEDDVAKGQIWLVPVAGGEPTRLTTLAEGVEDLAWSPDGRSIACVSKVRHGEHDPDSDVRVIRTVHYRFDAEGFLDDKYRQVFVVDVASGEARRLTDGPYEHRHPAWSPTGHEIAFDANREEGWEFSPVNDVYAVRVSGHAVRRVSDGTSDWSQPSWSPDGTRIACYGTRRIESESPRSELFVVPAGGGSPQSLTAEIDRNFRDGAIADVVSDPGRPPLWDERGESLSVVYSEQGQVQLARLTIADGELREVTSGRRRVGAISPIPGGGYVYAANTPTTPGELFACDRDGRNERRLTRFNDEWLAGVELSEPEPFWVESADGTPIHGWIMKPVGFEPGRKYPMVLEIHGGPFGMYGETLMHEFQLFAARGYVVLYTNPRGSTGYGDEFAGRLFRAWGKHDFPDLMAAVAWAIAQGYVDEHRLGVLGGSYGGFMTNWVISHTTRFKAAVTQRCVSNMFSSFGTDDIFFASSRQTIGADPWEDPDIYWELSPITYVDRIETPLLIEHQEQDYRCPIEQAEQLYTALKRRGKTVEFVRFRNERRGRCYRRVQRVVASHTARLWLYGVGMLLPALWFTLRYPLPGNTGRLTDLGGLSDHSRVEFGLFVAGITTWFVCYVLALRESRRISSRQALPVVFSIGAVLAGILALMYPVNATDIYLYAARSRLFTEYGDNPIAVLPLDYPGDAWRRYVDREWVDNTSPYGPLWNLVAAPITLVAGERIGVALAGFKLLAVASFLAGGLVIARILASGNGPSPASGALFYLWNPLVLWEGVGNGHNDVLMVLVLLLAMLAWYRRCDRLVIPLLVTAALLKYVALLLLPFAALALLRRSPTRRARRRLVVWSAVLSLAVALIALAPFYDIAAMRDSFQDQNRVARTSIAAVVVHTLDDHRPRAEVTQWVTRAATAILLGFLVWWALAIWKNPWRLPQVLFEVLFVFLLIVAWSFRSWYLIWLVGLGALLSWGWAAWRTIGWTVGTMAVYGLFIWIWGWWGASYFTVERMAVPVMFAPPLLLSLVALICTRGGQRPGEQLAPADAAATPRSERSG